MLPPAPPATSVDTGATTTSATGANSAPNADGATHFAKLFNAAKGQKPSKESSKTPDKASQHHSDDSAKATEDTKPTTKSTSAEDTKNNNGVAAQDSDTAVTQTQIASQLSAANTLPISGLPVAGLRASGRPVVGLPVAGLPISGIPVADNALLGGSSASDKTTGELAAGGNAAGGALPNGAVLNGTPTTGTQSTRARSITVPSPGAPSSGTPTPGTLSPGSPSTGAAIAGGATPSATTGASDPSAGQSAQQQSGKQGKDPSGQMPGTPNSSATANPATSPTTASDPSSFLSGLQDVATASLAIGTANSALGMTAIKADKQKPGAITSIDDLSTKPPVELLSASQTATPSTTPTSQPTNLGIVQAPQTGLPLDPYKQVIAVVDPFRQLGNGDYSMTLRLHPEELGHVDVNVMLRDGQISMHLSSDNPATRQALRETVNELRSQLESSGLQTGSLDVGTRDSRDRGQQQQRSPVAHQENEEAVDAGRQTFLSRLAQVTSASSSNDGPVDMHI